MSLDQLHVLFYTHLYNFLCNNFHPKFFCLFLHETAQLVTSDPLWKTRKIFNHFSSGHLSPEEGAFDQESMKSRSRCVNSCRQTRGSSPNDNHLIIFCIRSFHPSLLPFKII